MSRIILDESFYGIQIPSHGLWFNWRPLNYWSFDSKNSKDEFSSYDEAISAARKENLENYRIIKTQRIVSIIDVRFRKNYELESGSAIEGLKYE